ncbi:MAG: type I DNA topoisomerase [Bacteroidota bacterium]|nr:type I DNA topoisomerase [Bacteroidota bacterium]
MEKIKNLVIVESPAKAKTIEKILGKDFKVVSSFGHIRDLPERSIGVEIEKQFQPKYEIPKDKKDVVKKLRDMAKSSETVWLASDEDREGEAISWHLAEALDLDPLSTNRIVFHEITRKAIERAVQNPRKIDQNLVDAQQARRVLDRLVGYELSPVLWKKVRRGLSAGRVQSVAVRLIVERERDIQNFDPESAFRIVAIFTTSEGVNFKAELAERFKTEEEARDYLNKVSESSFSVDKLEKKPGKKSPAAPFTTSTLQQEASRKLGFSVSQTMTLAQKLYEAGHITYMRTDSVNLSQDAIQAAKSEIVRDFGEEYSQPRNFSTKSKGAQEAHEAIRPTSFDVREAGGDRNQKRLYDLIWKRSLASQMADAQIERTTVNLISDKNPALPNFVAKGEVIRFEGFLKVYLEGTDDDDSDEDRNALPRMQEGEQMNYQKVTATERFSRPPARFTEASLVKELEKLGIGRPSTYAPTISTIIKRKYVEKGDRDGEQRKYRELVLEGPSLSDSTLSETVGAERNKLFPTEIGTIVNDYLVDHFNQVMDYGFTAKVEEDFDRIAAGQEKWEEMIKDFYSDFHELVSTAGAGGKAEGAVRELGKDPKTGKPVYARFGKFGKMVQLGSVEDEEKPTFASIPEEVDLESVSLEQALKFLQLPRELGTYEGDPVSVGIGRFGPYVRFGKSYVSLQEGDRPLEVSLERAIELIKEKKEQDAKRNIAVFEEVSPKIEVLRGPYGPYLRQGKSNFKIPKGTDPETITLEEAQEIIKNAPPKGARKARRTTKKK